MIHVKSDPAEDLLKKMQEEPTENEDFLKEKQDIEEKEKALEQQKKAYLEKVKKTKLDSRQKVLNAILKCMDTYDIDISDIAIAKKYPEKIKKISQDTNKKTSQATKEKKPKFPQPPEGKKYFNPETKKSWSGRGPIDDSIRNHPDPNSLLVDKVVD
ncbi:H-NS histone family protein [Allochromatium humboldtianum]|uniref:H-NS histone family protein n=1 Tax=Allochromatium humboldtianum TaxID=504901 RepID=A0A850RIX4_9GAMM|nr:H-NS family nucleoid-associated regulatory protein [Allochromatium humboldtianum]NVZ11437.1 H-NS histone family protein [Allochromatium humboldtianum]